jgi:peroxiredoxin
MTGASKMITLSQPLCRPLFILVLLLGINVSFISLVSADEGPLMEPYPPNYPANNFKLSDITGEMHELKDFHGKHVLVNFWSMTCNVCKSEMTTLQSAYELLDTDDLVIISIHAGDPTGDVESVLTLNNIKYKVLFDTDLQLGDWGVPLMPTTFIVDPDGNIRYRAKGARVWNSPFMIDFIQGMLDSRTKSSNASESL